MNKLNVVFCKTGKKLQLISSADNKFSRLLSIILLTLLILSNVIAKEQGRVITGTVTDGSNGEPLPGVNIVIKGTTIGTITNNDGSYSIEAAQGQKLVFSFVGFKTAEIAVEEKNVINVELTPNISSLDELVVIGYGTVKRSDLTGSVVSVHKDDLTAIPVTNALETLQGKVAGMDMTKASGEAGAGVNFTIRGNRSITASNAPYIFVDGIPYGTNLDINPQDIESIEILKDASSTAIYGSRGANGVILITTKRGDAAKPRLSFNMYAGLNNVAGYPEFTQGEDWVKMRRESFRAVGQWSSEQDDPVIFSGYYDYIQKKQFVNWQEELIHQGYIQDYQLGVSGGTDKTAFSISADYNKEKGILKNDDFGRFTIRTTIDHKFNNWIKIGTSIHYAVTNRDRRYNPFNQANKQPPVGIVYDEEGNINIFPFGNNIYSPMADEIPGAYIDNELNKKMLSTSYLDINIFKFLSFKSTLGLTYEDKRIGFFADRNSLNRQGEKSYAKAENSNFNSWQWENYMTFDKTIGVNKIQIVAGSSAQKEKSEYFLSEGQDVFSSQMKFYALQATDKTLMNIKSEYKQEQLLSFFTRLNYTLLNKYLLTVAIRTDGASVLAPGNKSQTFPSAALAWKINEEDFMKTINFVSLLKLRLSYGLSGNSSVEAYQTDSRLGQTMYSWGELPAQGYYLRTMAAENLSWETTSTYNIGLDLGLFNNRISATIEKYWQHTYDLLLMRKLPTTLGYYSIIDNVGETKNEGIEFSLNSINLNSTSGLKWITDITFSHNKEKIVALADSTTKDIENGLFVGYPIKVYYDYEKIGIWQLGEEQAALAFGGFLPGEIKVLDYSKDSIFNAGDKHILGTPRPKWTMGINNRFEYKGIDFSFFIFARIGQMISSEAHSRYDLQALGVSIKADYWTPENPTNAYPRPNRTAPHRELISTLGYVDGSFVKIRDITLGYTLPNKISDKLKISNLRLYTTLKNYLTFSKLNPYDPERGGSASFPMTKQWIFGANITF
jgi:TonB-linked SusC/RagA family outer membrane protein